MSKFSISSPRAGVASRGSPTTTRSTNSSTNDADEKEPWMERATPGKFELFQVKIFPVVDYLISQPDHANHAFTKRWLQLKRTPNIPMTENISWRNLKILLGIKTLFEYRDFLTQCPGLSSAVKFQHSKTTKSGFEFGVYSKYKRVIPALSSPSAKILVESELEKSELEKSELDNDSYVFDVDFTPPAISVQHETTAKVNMAVATHDADIQPMPSLTEASNTPKQTNIFVPKEVVPAEDTDGSITTDGLAELAELTDDTAWVATEEATGFPHVHYRMFETVTNWMFYLKWQKALYAGLSALSKWERVAKLFQLAYLRDYITLMNECPGGQEHYELSWDYFDNTIKYKQLALPDTEDVLHDINKLNALQCKMHQMAFKFDSCMQQYNSRLADNDARITGCEVSIAEQLNRATSRFAASATKHYNSLTEYASTTFAKFQSNLQAYTEKLMSTQRSKLLEMHNANHQKIQYDFREAEKAFQARIEEAMERAVHEILSTADDATDSINEQAHQIFQQLKSDFAPAPRTQGDISWKYVEPKPSKLFPHVDVSSFPPVHPTAHPTPSSNKDIGDYGVYHVPSTTTTWDKNGPNLLTYLRRKLSIRRVSHL